MEDALWELYNQLPKEEVCPGSRAHLLKKIGELTVWKRTRFSNRVTAAEIANEAARKGDLRTAVYYAVLFAATDISTPDQASLRDDLRRYVSLNLPR